MTDIQALRTRLGIVMIFLVCIAVVIAAAIGMDHHFFPAASTFLPKSTVLFTDTSSQLQVNKPTVAVPNAVDPNDAGLGVTGNPQPSDTSGGVPSVGSASASSTSQTGNPSAVPAPPGPVPTPTRPCGCYGSGGRMCPMAVSGSAQPQILCYSCGTTPTSDAIACLIE